VDPLLVRRIDGTIEDFDTHQPISHAIVSRSYTTSATLDNGTRPQLRQCTASDDQGRFAFGADLLFNFFLLDQWDEPTISAIAGDGIDYVIPEAEGAQPEYWDAKDFMKDRSSWAKITSRQVVLKVRRWRNESVRDQRCTYWREHSNSYSWKCDWLMRSWCSGP
jgi:hypothetical protein